MTVQVTILGSGTLLPDDLHRSAGHLVEWSGGRLLLDCGSGVLHGLARDGRDWRSISHVAISHYHTDHFGDLPALLWAWTHGGGPDGPREVKTLLGPDGIRSRLEAARRMYGDFILEPGGPLHIVEIEAEGRWEDPESKLVLCSRAVPHTPESVAYRVEVDGRSIGYTGDTGPHRPLEEFFRDVDVLIAECAVPDERTAAGHLSPRSVSELAVAANPAHLVLTHLYPEVDRFALPGQIQAFGYGGRVQVATDGIQIQLGTR